MINRSENAKWERFIITFFTNFEKHKPSNSRKNDVLQVMGDFPGDEDDETGEKLPPEEIEAKHDQENIRIVSFEAEGEVHHTEEVQAQNEYSNSWLLANVRYSRKCEGGQLL